MTKVYRCNEVVPGCEQVLHGDSESDLMVLVAEHAHEAHDVEHLSDQLKAKIRAAIRDA
jgi:predicted small metal-binding protein